MSSPNILTPLRNICMTMAYDGARYFGWQVQANGPSVQGAVEEAIRRLTGEACTVFSAGRTDSGVHALGQVINFKTTSPIPVVNWRGALQSFLPDDIVVRHVWEASPDFHSTYSAKQKRYRYVVYNGALSMPFLRNYSYHMRKRLDSQAMHDAAQVLVGTHDFRSFETDWPNTSSSVRTVMEITIYRQRGWVAWMAGDHPDAHTLPGTADDFVCMDIVADGFLYNMVRSIMGTLIHVGRGTWSADDLARILTAQNRSVAGNTAPACGLYLVSVDYGERPENLLP